jgi:argininosuccinate lyase
MLLDTGVLDREQAEPILRGLSELLADLESGALTVEGPDEDVHSWIERQLIEAVGDAGRRLHTARSRNDQTATALRLWVRAEIEGLLAHLVMVQRQRLEQAGEHLETFLPGYTHLQRGQPVSLAHHLLAWVWALDADARRLQRAWDAAGQSPLGAGALAATPHPIDPWHSARLLGFEAPYDNSLWAVADRDYVVETSFSCALLMVHLSRWAEEVILWTSSEFGFAELDDSVAKGSSLMPQKKNPEPAEILRGKSGRAIGDLTAHLVQLKGLPLTYNSDLQEDKEALFDAVDTAAGALRVSLPLAAGLRYRPERMAAALEGSYVTATDLADLLVERGVPFRVAHERAGAMVRVCEQKGVELWELDEAELREHCPELEAGDRDALRPEASVRRRKTWNGPAPEAVAAQLVRATEAVDRVEAWLEARQPPPIVHAFGAGELLAERIPGSEAD